MVELNSKEMLLTAIKNRAAAGLPGLVKALSIKNDYLQPPNFPIQELLILEPTI